MHCALAHHCRRAGGDPQLWNQATDYAVNPILINNGITLPKDALIDTAFADLGAEEIYARLLKQGQDSAPAQSPSQSSARSGGASGDNAPEQTPQSAPQETQSPPRQPEQQPQLPGVSDRPLPARQGGFGEGLDAVGEDDKPASPAELSRQMHEWAINAEQALCSAKACGHEPGGIERPLEQARQSEHDWRAILRDFIAATNPSDYRWAPPNRRFVSSPTRRSRSRFASSTAMQPCRPWKSSAHVSRSNCRPRAAEEPTSCRPSSGWKRMPSSRSASST